MALKINKENVVYGLENVLQNVAPQPIKSKREATTADRAAIGTTWINQTNDSYAVLTNIAANQSTWQKYPTGSGPFNLNSETIRLHATDAGDPTAILIEANAAGSGVNIYGHDNVDILSTANVNVNAGAGTINIGNVPLLPIANTINIGNALSHVNINGGPASIVMTTDDGEISLSSGTGAINIGTDAAAKTISVGNVTGATGLVLNSGTAGIQMASTGAGDITLNSSDTVLIDSAGVLELNSSAGVISIGNDAVAQNVNIGTGAAQRVITIGNSIDASECILNSGTAGIAMTTTGSGDVTINTGSVYRGGTAVTPYALVAGGTTNVGPMQQISSLGSVGDVLTSNGAGALPTWQPAGGSSFTWSAVNTSGTFTVNTGIIYRVIGSITWDLPADPAVGDQIGVWIENSSYSNVKIQQTGAGELILVDGSYTTIGATGYVQSFQGASSYLGSYIILTCMVANNGSNLWVATSSQPTTLTYTNKVWEVH